MYIYHDGILPFRPTNNITPLSTLLSPVRAHYLTTMHLLDVFSNAPSALASTAATALREKYADLYGAGITIYENDGGVVSGRDSVEELVERLVGKGGQFEGWKFVVRGNVKSNGDLVWVTGVDAILLEKWEDEVVRIKKAYVIDRMSDVGGSG